MDRLEDQPTSSGRVEDETYVRRTHTIARRKVTAAMVVAFVTMVPLGFTSVMWLDVPAECRRWNTGAIVDACIAGERGELFWTTPAVLLAMLGLVVVLVVALVSLEEFGPACLSTGAVAATAATNVWLSRGLTYDEITGDAFPLVYLPTTVLMTWLTLRWVPAGVVDGDRSAGAAWLGLVGAATASLIGAAVIGTLDRLLWWFAPVVLGALMTAAVVVASMRCPDRRARIRRLSAVLVPVACAVGLVSSIAFG